MANTTSSSSLPIHSMSGIPIYNSSSNHHSVYTPNLSHSIFASNVKFPMSLSKNQWVIDIGATDHKVHSILCLTTVTSTINALVELPNGKFVSVTHIGIVEFSPSLTLTNVLCVPSFYLNLISVSKLIHSLSCCLIFLSNHCFIQAFTPWRMIRLGKLHNGLYLLQTQVNKSNCATVVPHSSFFQLVPHFSNNVSAPASV